MFKTTSKDVMTTKKILNASQIACFEKVKKTHTLHSVPILNLPSERMFVTLLDLTLCLKHTCLKLQFQGQHPQSSFCAKMYLKVYQKII